jgi:hypothetical protein
MILEVVSFKYFLWILYPRFVGLSSSLKDINVLYIQVIDYGTYSPSEYLVNGNKYMMRYYLDEIYPSQAKFV